MRFRRIAGISALGDDIALLYHVPDLDIDALRHKMSQYTVFIFMMSYSYIVSSDVHIGIGTKVKQERKHCRKNITNIAIHLHKKCVKIT